MSKATPWSVKGVDEETRALARDAAQASGLTIGAWIDLAILRHAGLLPVEENRAPELVDSSDQAAALEAQAEALSQTADAAERRLNASLKPAALDVAQAAQRMVALESSFRAGAPFKPKPAILDEAESESSETPPEDGTEPDFSPPMPEESVTIEATAVPLEDAERLVRDETTPAEARRVSGKMIVGTGVLALGIAAGVALMSQADRIGLGPALQRLERMVEGWVEDVGSSLQREARPVERAETPPPSQSALPVEPPPAIDPATPQAVAAAAPEQSETFPEPPPPTPAQALPAAPRTLPPLRATEAAPERPPESAAEPKAPEKVAALTAAAPEPSAAEQPPAPPPALSRTRLNDRSVPREPAAFARWVEDRAKQGERMAQHDLAVLFAQGEGRPQDMEKAAYWFREAAVQGVANAQYNLGVLYETGRGVQQDDVRALLWYHSAAEQGHAKAQHNLGSFYAAGRGIPVSYGEARKWLRRSGDQGFAPALRDLARIEERGLGAPPDIEKARALYAQAMVLGDEEAAKRLTALPPVPAGAMTVAAGAGGDSLVLSPEAERETIRAVQRFLAAGAADVAADGLMGEKTREAIRDYERKAGLPITGQVGPRLLNHMILRSVRSAGVDRGTTVR
ncbi:SEL1-like repeat protein [Oceanibaculum pacificum]|uniref:Peptidoglycan binding-like domain-containing protein n=1 Tax=Oceanibaculum pacificum TaxID=580166 RepID=A0A154WH38_9PROT|nr:SEL1-like repeat protein [Oceanibaculum pacificum]KZD12853.1 hypothetical protein AUP43_00495 [Oceanibaculum pacificum]